VCDIMGRMFEMSYFRRDELNLNGESRNFETGYTLVEYSLAGKTTGGMLGSMRLPELEFENRAQGTNVDSLEEVAGKVVEKMGEEPGGVVYLSAFRGDYNHMHSSGCPMITTTGDDVIVQGNYDSTSDVIFIANMIADGLKKERDA